MRSPWAAVAASCVVMAGCSDGTGPRPIAGSLTLDFCASEAPVWFAYQNEGSDWTRVEGTFDNSYTFDVTERVTIAMAFDFGTEALTDIYYATRTELMPLSDKACVETAGAKTVHGSVANVEVGDRVVVSMSGAEAVLVSPANTFTLQNVATGPQDVVAHNEFPTTEGDVPDRVIIRRAQNPTNDATMQALDFSSATSAALTVNLASISGLNAGEENYLDVFFLTALGTNHWLYAAPFFSTSSQTIYGVPAALTQQGDLHQLELQAQPTNGDSYRAIRRWYRDPANQSLVLGPSLSLPQITRLGTSPYLRLRATLASQPEYDSFATAYFIQGPDNDRRSVFVTHTAGFHGGAPSTWRLDIPDVTAAGGYPAYAQLISGDGTRYFVEAFDGSLADFIGATPTANATVRWAGRSNTVVALRAEGEQGTMRGGGRPLRLEQRGLRR